MSAIAADNRPLSPKGGPDGAGHETIPVQVAASVKITASSYAYRRAICGRIGLRQEIRTRFAHVIWMTALQRRSFTIGEMFVRPVGLIRGRHQYLANTGRSPARLEDAPGAADVRVEGTNWISVCDSDDCLSGQVKYGLDFVFSQHTLHHRLVLDLTPHDSDVVQDSRAKQLVTRDPVANDANDECAAVN